jgi:hypothetical protein
MVHHVHVKYQRYLPLHHLVSCVATSALGKAGPQSVSEKYSTHLTKAHSIRG